MVPFTSNSNAAFTVRAIFFFLTVCAPLLGNTMSNALEVTSVEARIKNIRSRNTRSVIDDMFTSALTLLLDLRFIARCYAGSCRRSRKSIALDSSL